MAEQFLFAGPGPSATAPATDGRRLLRSGPRTWRSRPSLNGEGARPADRAPRARRSLQPVKWQCRPGPFMLSFPRVAARWAPRSSCPWRPGPSPGRRRRTGGHRARRCGAGTARSPACALGHPSAAGTTSLGAGPGFRRSGPPACWRPCDGPPPPRRPYPRHCGPRASSAASAVGVSASLGATTDAPRHLRPPPPRDHGVLQQVEDAHAPESGLGGGSSTDGVSDLGASSESRWSTSFAASSRAVSDARPKLRSTVAEIEA
jgi:hypothetical protein